MGWWSKNLFTSLFVFTAGVRFPSKSVQALHQGILSFSLVDCIGNATNGGKANQVWKTYDRSCGKPLLSTNPILCPNWFRPTGALL